MKNFDIPRSSFFILRACTRRQSRLLMVHDDFRFFVSTGLVPLLGAILRGGFLAAGFSGLAGLLVAVGAGVVLFTRSTLWRRASIKLMTRAGSAGGGLTSSWPATL